jgi:hydrogenase maturation protease
VIVVDTVVSGGRPGAIYRFNAHSAGVPAQLSRSPSSHGWGVAEALALGQVFQELPPFLVIYGIEGKNFGPGQEVSQEVEAAIPEAVRRLRQEIQAWLGREPLEEIPP